MNCLNSLLTSVLYGGKRFVSRPAHFTSRERRLVPFEQESAWVSDRGWSFWKRGKSLAPTRTRTSSKYLHELQYVNGLGVNRKAIKKSILPTESSRVESSPVQSSRTLESRGVHTDWVESNEVRASPSVLLVLFEQCTSKELHSDGEF